MNKKIILTGDRPTGPLHLGHFVGSIQNRVEMQKNDKVYIIIANTQGLTDYFNNPELLKNNIYQLVSDYISCGIDHEKTTIFLQSQIPALAELTIYYMNLVSLSRLQRNPTIKEQLKHKSFKNNIIALKNHLCTDIFSSY